MFKAPKAMVEQDSKMTEADRVRLEARKKEVQAILTNGVDYTDAQANAAVEAFNSDWIAAGGHAGSTLVTRDALPSWQVAR